MRAPQPPAAGLCETCRHARLVPTPRSAFWLCERARDDPRFERYPRLPVLRCPGHEPGPRDETPPGANPGGVSRDDAAD